MRPKQIGRSWGFGRAGRRRATAGDSVRGGAALGSPEFAVYGVPGVNPTGVWLWGDLRDMRNPLAALSGLGEACNSERRPPRPPIPAADHAARIPDPKHTPVSTSAVRSVFFR